MANEQIPGVGYVNVDLIAAAVKAAASSIGVCQIRGVTDPNLPAIGATIGKIAKEILIELKTGE